MTTQTYLSQIERFDRMILNKEMQIEELRTAATSITVATDNEKISSSSNKDKIGTLGAMIADLSNEIENIKVKRKVIEKQIESVTNIRQYDTLVWTYVLHKNNYDIATHFDCSIENVKKLKSKAIKEFEKIYGTNYLQLP